jgi:hypothetical protein
MKCPGCNKTITEKEIKNVLNALNDQPNPPMIQRLTSEDDRRMLRDFLTQLNIVTCSCGNMMEVVEGEFDPLLKDDAGN